MVVDDPDLRAVVGTTLGEVDLLVGLVEPMRGVPGDLGQAVVAERRHAERLPHRDAALPGETGSRKHAHRRQRKSALQLCVDQVRRMRRHRQDVRAAMLLDEPQGVLGAPPVDEHPRGAVEQRREVAEHEAADETELAHDEVHVVAGQLPALADAFGGIPQRVVRVRDALRGRRGPGGVEHHRQVVGMTWGVLVRWVVLGQAVDELRLDREEQRNLIRHLAALGELLLSAEADQPLGPRLHDQRRQLRLVEHRRKRRDHHASVHATEHRHRGLDRVTPEEDDDVSRLDTALGEPERHAYSSPPKLIEREDAVVEDQRRLVRALLRATGEVAPQVSLTPVSLRVIAICLGLER